MKISNPIITNTGLVIDPDDDTVIIRHTRYYEFVHDKYSNYCSNIYPYGYD